MNKIKSLEDLNEYPDSLINLKKSVNEYYNDLIGIRKTMCDFCNGLSLFILLPSLAISGVLFYSAFKINEFNHIKPNTSKIEIQKPNESITNSNPTNYNFYIRPK